LNNGTVLIAGGYYNTSGSGGGFSSSVYLNTAELYDPAAGTFSLTGSLNTARYSATATLLNNGNVLVAGGANSRGVVASAELYEPGTLTPPNLVSISMTPSNASIVPGSAQSMTATGTFSNGGTEQLASVTWSSTASAAVTVTNDVTNLGTVYGVALGSSNISACTGSICGSTSVTVAGQPALTITAPNLTIAPGAAIPALTPTYSGFVNGQNASSLTTSASCITTATSSSPAGTYPITCSGAVDSNYTISYASGTLTIAQVKVLLSGLSISVDGSGYALVVNLQNAGNVTISQLNLSAATLGGSAALTFPAGTTITYLAPGAIATITATFSSAAGPAGKGVPLSLSGNYTAAGGLSGNWAENMRSETLP